MSDIDNNITDVSQFGETTGATEEVAAESKTALAEETSAQDSAPQEGTTEEQAAQEQKKKIKLPAFLEKFIAYLKTHEDIRQMVLFFLFSMICGGTQFIITLILPLLLNLSPKLQPAFSWFLFKYESTGEFIGFLVGSVVGQVLTFVLNRKKTFNVPNYLVMRAIMYAIMAVLIILMQTYLGGVVTTACQNAAPNASTLLISVFNITGQAVAGIAALIVNFLGNKFFVMRDWGGKIKKANEEKARAEAALAAAADVQESTETSAETAEDSAPTEEGAQEPSPAEAPAQNADNEE